MEFLGQIARETSVTKPNVFFIPMTAFLIART
jgi:hypothetical protein